MQGPQVRATWSSTLKFCHSSDASTTGVPPTWQSGFPSIMNALIRTGKLRGNCPRERSSKGQTDTPEGVREKERGRACIRGTVAPAPLPRLPAVPYQLTVLETAEHLSGHAAFIEQNHQHLGATPEATTGGDTQDQSTMVT